MNIKGVLRSRGIALVNVANITVGMKLAEISYGLREPFTVASVEIKPERIEKNRWGEQCIAGETLVKDTNGKLHRLSHPMSNPQYRWGADGSLVIEVTQETADKLKAFYLDYHTKNHKRWSDYAKQSYERQQKWRDERLARTTEYFNKYGA